MLAEEILSAKHPALENSAQSHPMNSSRLLLDLISLAKESTDTTGWNALIERSALRSLMLTLQYRDANIVNHARRVASLGVAVGQYLGWEGTELQILEAACLLHDVGKIGIPDLILHKPGRLAPEETHLMTLIDEIACDVLQACRAHDDIVQIVSQMPLHFNGASHGFHTIGSDVHQGARILAVIDAYDSLVTKQVFRDRYSHKEAMEILHRGAGSQFDGNVIAALARWFEFNGVPEQLYAEQPAYNLSPDEIMEAGSVCQVFSYLYLLESLYDGFHITGPDGQVQVWSSGLSRLMGVDWRQTKGSFVGNFIEFKSKYGEPLKPQDYPVFSVAESGRSQTNELLMRQKGDEWHPVEVQTMPLVDQAGKLHGFAEIMRDLSGRNTKEGDRDLRLMASRDALTHVANRGELKIHLELRMAEYRATNCEKPFSVIFLDVDHFKRANDTYGHAAGDEVLVSIARLLQHETYSGELVARYGGEEFVILCPDTKLEEAYNRAERLRNAIAKARVVQSNEFRVTSSFGVSEVEPSDAADSVLQRADKALYMSKHSGRNKTSKLTSEQLRNADPNLVNPPKVAASTRKFETKIRACLASSMIVYKVRAFVDEYKAKIVEVSDSRVQLRIGSRGLVPFWGSSPERQPVEVVLEFGDDRSSISRGASKLVEIQVLISPLGWATNADQFQLRAKAVVKDLREFFAADVEHNN